jgi:hypothetical protein
MNQEVWLPESGWWDMLPITLSSPACFGGAKKMKYQKWGDDRHMEVGQDKELSPKLLSQGEVTHNTALNTLRGMVGKRVKMKGSLEESKKKGLFVLFLGQSTHRWKADSFPTRGRPPPNFYPITVFSSLGARTKKGYCRVLWYYIHSTRPG